MAAKPYSSRYTFSRFSLRSCASTESVAIGRASSRFRQIGVIDVLFLQRLQRDSRFAQDLVLPCQQLGAKVIALAIVHERLFFGGSVVLQLFQGQPIFTCKAGPKRVGPRAPYIAAS